MSGTRIETGVKDSGYRWLGAIPAHWTTTEIRRIADIRLGKMLQTAPNSPDDVEMPYVSAINVQPEGLSIEPKKSMWFSRAEQEELTVEPGDVLVVEGGSVGRSVYLADGLEGWRFQNSINRVRSKPALSVGAFIDYALRHLQSEGVIEMVCNKATIMHLTAEKLGRLRIALPSVSEQERIVSYLDYETAEIDAFIADQDELIALLNERRAATITQAVTNGLDLSVQMKDSGAPWVGKMPEDWEIIPLKWKSRLVTGITPSTFEERYYSEDEEDFQWIRPEDLDVTGQATRASKFLSPEGEKQVRVVPPATVLMCCIGATLGKVGITDKPAATNQQITAIISSLWLGKYLFYSLQASRQDIEVLSVGNTLPILNNGRLGAHLVPMPSLEEQQEIVSYLDFEAAEIDAAIADAKKAIELSKERRAALISAAVTGKIDVRNHITAELGAA